MALMLSELLHLFAAKSARRPAPIQKTL
ncbi:hypothetical protein JMJ77_0007328, partial [Colletotrichum scovillei]